MKVTIERLKDAQVKASDIIDFHYSDFHKLLEHLEDCLGFNLHEKIWGKKYKLEQDLEEEFAEYSELLESEDFDKAVEEFGRETIVTYINYMDKVSANLYELNKIKNKCILHF